MPVRWRFYWKKNLELLALERAHLLTVSRGVVALSVAGATPAKCSKECSGIHGSASDRQRAGGPNRFWIHCAMRSRTEVQVLNS